MYQIHYNSPIGKLIIISDGEYITNIYFDNDTRTHSEKPRLSPFIDIIKWLDTYFRGETPDFTPKFKASGTDFQMEVWNILSTIPYGNTMTYGDIAKKIATSHNTKMSAQAVGGAVGKNPIPILIPCHRVLGAGGKITGYSGGLDKKVTLLDIEHIAHI